MSGNGEAVCAKRMKRSSSTGDRNQVIVHQNVQLLPPAPGYDEEGRLPESLGPTPTINLVTEDEESEVERTPRRTSPVIGVRHRPQRPVPGELDHAAIEADAAASTFTPPTPLRRLRTGKNLAMLRSIAEALPAPASPESPESPRSPAPPPSPTASVVSEAGSEAGPAPNILALLEEERRRQEFIEEERRRLEEGKRRLQDMASRLRRRRRRNEEDIQGLERQIAKLQKSLESRVATRIQLDFELDSIDNFCRQ